MKHSAAVPEPASSRAQGLAAAAAMFAAAAALYFITMAPVVTFVDSGELAAVVATSGVSHPSGSPMYLLLGSLVAAIPAGSLIWRLNAFSAVCSAACVCLTYLYFRLGCGSGSAPARAKQKEKGKKASKPPAAPPAPAGLWSAAAAAGLAMMSNRALWSTATVTEVYALHAMLLALLALFLGMHVREVKANPEAPRQRFLGAAAFVAGLGASNYPPFGIVGPAVLAVLWRVEGLSLALRWRRNLLMIGCIAAGLLPYLLLPVRAAADPLLNWGNPSNWERLWRHVSAQQYSVFLGSPRLDLLPNALKLWWGQWPPGIWILMVPGILFFRRTRPVSFLFTAILGITNILYVLCYDITDVSSAPSDYYVYLLPLCWCSALWIGAGACSLLQWLTGTRVLAPATIVAALIPAVSIPLHWKEMDKSRYTYADDFARGILESVKPNALILTPDWTFVSPSMYLQFGEHVRTDVLVLDGELLRRSWYLPFVEERSPALYSACLPAISAFLSELAKYEEGRPYDGNLITQKYVAMLNGLLEEALKQNRPPYILLNLQARELNEESYRDAEQQLRRPPYATPGVSPGAIGNRFQWVPETLAFRLYEDDGPHLLPEIRVPPRPLAAGQWYDNVTEGVLGRYAEFWRYRGDYYRLAAADCGQAAGAYRKSLEILERPEARAGLAACSH